jgi:hypothetical protein
MQNLGTTSQSRNLTTREIVREFRADLQRLSYLDKLKVYLFIFKLRLKRIRAHFHQLQKHPPIHILIPAAIIVIRIAG